MRLPDCKHSEYDAVVVGSGPNGLSAAIALAQKGVRVHVVEAADRIGGGTRTQELTLEGFHHDVCSAVHPMGVLSPFWKELPLEKHGLTWIYPEASMAHPLDGESAVLQYQSLEQTIDNLGADGKNWRKMIKPFLQNPEGLLQDALKPLGLPRHPILMARFGMQAMWPASWYAKMRFSTHRARALFAGSAGHSVLPLETMFSSAIGLMLVITGHMVKWPVAAGGSIQIANALASVLSELGGTIETNRLISTLDDLPAAKVYLFDTDPKQLATIGEPILPRRYVKRLLRYHYGPGTCKVDFALSEPIPWSDPNCLKATTVHVGGTLEEIALSERDAWNGRITDKPYLIVCQQSQFDPSRAPKGKHTGYAYCHVPFDADVDRSEAIVSQIERFAPGFRDIILEQHVTSAKAFAQYNRNYVGGTITGGAATITQLFTRPVARLDPYSTPHPRLFLCSHATPPGGGVHGICGYYAAQSAYKQIRK